MGSIESLQPAAIGNRVNAKPSEPKAERRKRDAGVQESTAASGRPAGTAEQEQTATQMLRVEQQQITNETSAASQSGTFMRFNVDSETHAVTVMVVDTKSREVLRTIPPEELANMGYDRIVDLLI